MTNDTTPARTAPAPAPRWLIKSRTVSLTYPHPAEAHAAALARSRNHPAEHVEVFDAARELVGAYLNGRCVRDYTLAEYREAYEWAREQVRAEAYPSYAALYAAVRAKVKPYRAKYAAAHNLAAAEDVDACEAEHYRRLGI